MPEGKSVSNPVPKVVKTKKKRKVDIPAWAAQVVEQVPLVNHRNQLYRYSSKWGKYLPFDPPSGKTFSDWSPVVTRALGFCPIPSYWSAIQAELIYQAEKRWKTDSHMFFSNGALNIKSGDFTPVPESRKYFNLSVVATDYDPNAECPTWQKWLQGRIVPEYHALIQEFFGYILYPHNHYRKFFILHGPARTGKTTLTNVIRMVIGDENVSGCGLNKLGQDFGPIETLGKMVNLSTEWARTGRKIDEGILKGFVSGDYMEMTRKFLPSIHAIPTAKLLFAMNELPHFADKSDGLADRMVLLPFENPIPQEDVLVGFENLFFIPELSGIVNWALVGYRQLLQRGGFSVTEDMIEKHRQYWQEQSSARLFLDEMTEFVGEGYITRNELFEGYLAWCKRYNEQPLRRENFFKEVRNFYPEAREGQIRDKSNRPRIFRGIAYDLFGG